MKSTISFLFLIIEAPCEKKLISTIIIILFHSKIERDTMKFKLNRWRKIDWNRGKTGPNQSYRQFSSFSRKGWSKNKMKKEGKGGEEKNGEGTKICMSRKICVSLSWFSSSPFFFFSFLFFFFSRPNDAETGQKLKPLVRAKTVSKSNGSNGAVHPRTQIRYSRRKGNSRKRGVDPCLVSLLS